MKALVLLTLLCSACVTTTRVRTLVNTPITWPPDTQVRWYDVEGDDERALREQLDARGPEDLHGLRHDAFTAWHITWRYPLQHEEAGCTTGPVTTTVRVTITLPQWQSELPATDPRVQHWQRYVAALQEHESGHRETGFDAANAITEKLAALPPQSSCDEAERIADETARHILDEYRSHDTEYDLQTRHGETQGAMFP